MQIYSDTKDQYAEEEFPNDDPREIDEGKFFFVWIIIIYNNRSIKANNQFLCGY
jgi:hypothetical protein